MNIVRRNTSPLSVYRPPSLIGDQFGRLVENIVEDFFSPVDRYSLASRLDTGEASASPRINLSETDKDFEVEAELPGVKKEDIKVSVDDKRRVTIEAEAKRESAQTEGENVVYAERSFRKYARSFTLPVDVDDGAAQAKYEDGVLTLTLPKSAAAQPKQLTVQ